MATYYIKNGGNNALDGLSDGNAWETIAKVNSVSFSAGDIISFKCGSVWRETLEIPSSGTSESYIKFGTYGTGDNPRILGSKATTTWTDQGSNVWKTTITFTNPRSLYPYYADVTFNDAGTELFGSYVANTGSLAKEYDWTWSSNYIYVYSTSNPATAYDGIEVPQRRFCISTNDKEYLHFDGIDLFFAADIGFDTNSDHGDHADISGCIIENAEIGFIGGVSTGAYQYGFGLSPIYSDLIIRNCEIHHCGRRGLSLDLIGTGTIFTASNALIEDCEFHHGYHTTALDCNVNNGGNYASWDSIIFRRNLVWDEETWNPGYNVNQMFFQQYSGVGDLEGIYIYNNIFKFSPGNSISLEGIQGANIVHNTFYGVKSNGTGIYQVYAENGSGVTLTNVVIKNNIFHSLLTNETSGNGAGLVTYNITDSNIDADYNLYYRSSNSYRIMLLTGTSYYMNSSFPVSEGYETHGVKGNPGFTSSTNYTLTSGSPAIGAATPILYVTTDYAGNARDNTNPDIGAYEYDSSPSVDYIIIGKAKIHKYSIS